ncbi:MAG: peptidylprolyl isomerase [Chthoniobacterales bacterium]
MKRALSVTSVVVAGLAAGLACSEVVVRSVICRQTIGRWFARGQLLAIVRGAGIYETDVEGHDAESVRAAIAAANLRSVDEHEIVSKFEVDSAEAILRAQFGDERAFRQALKGGSLSENQFCQMIADELRGVQWLEKRSAPALQKSEEIYRTYAREHPGESMQPARSRVSHIFLAAHSATPPEEVESKRKLIDFFAKSLAEGANFAQLAAEVSEDETSKKRGGDLGFICAERIPPEFFSVVAKLRPGQISPPFRSHLGFHIAQVTDVRPPREMSFDEVKHEIATEVENRTRNAALSGVVARLSVTDFLQLFP